jgi:hypothetical protein
MSIHHAIANLEHFQQHPDSQSPESQNSVTASNIDWVLISHLVISSFLWVFLALHRNRVGHSFWPFADAWEQMQVDSCLWS